MKDGLTKIEKITAVVVILILIMSVIIPFFDNKENFHSQELFRLQGKANNIIINSNHATLQQIKFLLVNISEIKNGEIILEGPSVELSKNYIEGKETDKEFRSKVNEYYNKKLKDYSTEYNIIKENINKEIQNYRKWKILKNIGFIINTLLIIFLAFLNYLLIRKDIRILK